MARRYGERERGKFCRGPLLSHHQWTTRIFALVLAIGGIIGIAMVVEESWIGSGSSALARILAGALFAFALFTGFRLWKGTPFGRKWAAIVFASQIPVLSLTDLNYDWFTGTQLIISISKGADAIRYLNFSLSGIGGGFEFRIGEDLTEYIIGVNLFALVASILLLRAYRAFRRSKVAENRLSEVAEKVF